QTGRGRAMSDKIVAKRYADALFQLADEKNNAESLIDELAIVKKIFNANNQFVQLLNFPQISNRKKWTLIDDTFGQFNKDIIHTLKLLIERQRIGIIFEVIDQVTERYNETYGIAEATVHSVRELSEKESENIKDSLKKQLQKEEIIIHNVVDPSVLG